MKSTIALCILAVLLAKGHCKDLVKGNRKVNSFKVIDIMIAVDTDRLTADFDGKGPSKKSDKPTPINNSYAFMITNNNTVLSGQATADLHIRCVPTDIIRLYGVSQSSNLGNQIIVYAMKHNSKLLRSVNQFTLKKENVYPLPNNITEPERIKIRTYVIQATVLNYGPPTINVNFAVYITRRDNGVRELFGYFTWNPTITIKF